MLGLKRLLANWVNDGNREMNNKYPALTSDAKRKSPCDEAEFKNPLNITLYNATGGRIVKFTRYDRSCDELYENTYIVSSDENFEEALGKFIALEALKHVN